MRFAWATMAAINIRLDAWLKFTSFRAAAEMFWKMKDKCIIASAGDALGI